MKTTDVMERVEAGLDQLNHDLAQGHSDTLKKYLSVMGRFHSYSFGNCLLIMMQQPDATHVAGFHAWKKLGRSVKKGEKGVVIIAPLARRRNVQNDEEETKTLRVVTGFKAVYVFDVSQTEGEELPPFATISGDPDDKIDRMELLIRKAGITLEYGPLHCEGVSKDGHIVIKEGLPAAERFAVLVHEAAHEFLHKGERRHETTKAIRETEAEAVAYVVCQACGLDNSTRSSDYIQLHRGDTEMLGESLDFIQKTAASILQQLEQAAEVPV